MPEIHQVQVGATFRIWYAAKDAAGLIQGGLVAGDFLATLVSPADAILGTIAVVPSTKAGAYYIDVPGALITTVGQHGVTLEKFAVPRDVQSWTLDARLETIDTIPTTGEIATAVRAEALTEDEIAEAVWQEDLLNHLGPPTRAGQALLDADVTVVVPTTGDIAQAVRAEAITETEMAEAVWNQDLNNHLGLPKAGQSLLDADVVAVVPSTGDIADAVRDRAITESEIAEAVWQEDLNNHLGPDNKAGQALLNADQVAVVPSTGDIAQAVRAEALTESEIAEAVWQEELLSHQGGTKAGQKLLDADQVSVMPTTGEIACAVWEKQTIGFTGQGSFGGLLATRPSAEAVRNEIMAYVLENNPGNWTVESTLNFLRQIDFNRLELDDGGVASPNLVLYDDLGVARFKWNVRDKTLSAIDQADQGPSKRGPGGTA